MENKKLAKKLILDELFDLRLFEKLAGLNAGETKATLEKLVEIERGHIDFWQKFFGVAFGELNPGRKIKLWFFVSAIRVFGETAFHFILEAIEVYGIRKHLVVWKKYKDTELGEAIKNILKDELEYEDEVIGTLIAQRKVSPERIRNIFLGFNDGLVEILGAVSGFFAAFENISSILIAGFTVAVAGSISMAAGVFAASSSETEVKELEDGKREALGYKSPKHSAKERPLASGIVVGITYFLGALIPILPVLFGARNVLSSWLAGAGIVILVSFILALISGMEIKKRILMNLAIIAVAVSVTYGIGVAARAIFDVSI